jgi:DNA-directed RNA polymerase specialized sigma24 family protein
MGIQERALVREGLARLGAREQASLVLAYYEGLTHAEVATRLRRPLGTVKSRIRRALVSMRALEKPPWTTERANTGPPTNEFQRAQATEVRYVHSNRRSWT